MKHPTCDSTCASKHTRYNNFFAGVSVEVYCDPGKNLKGMFFQDQQMMQTFKVYPELLCLDATYKLIELRLPVYIMLC